jgi:hypothetical protein
VPACERPQLEATAAAVRSELGDVRYEAESRAGREGRLDALVAAGL